MTMIPFLIFVFIEMGEATRIDIEVILSFSFVIFNLYCEQNSNNILTNIFSINAYHRIGNCNILNKRVYLISSF